MLAQVLELLPLLLIVMFAFVAEASLGFGSTILTVTLGASLMPIHDLLPAFVPLNLLASIWILGRSPRAVDGGLLGKTLLPWLAVGMPLGLLAFLVMEPGPLARILGALVVVLAARELLPGKGGTALPPRPAVARGMLALGGLAHGAFGSGGPFVVYVAGRSGLGKDRFRATLAALWILLSVALLVAYLADGRIDGASLGRTAAMAAAAALGLVIGDRIFQRIPPDRFRQFVFALLLVAGLVLLLGG